MIETAFWKGRKVFITGPTGFKGSWYKAYLDARNMRKICEQQIEEYLANA